MNFRVVKCLNLKMFISGIFEEVSYVDTMAELEAVNITHERNEIVKVNSLEMYEFLSQVHGTERIIFS